MEDAGVLISGVVFTRCNSRQELVGISIETSRVEDVQIYRPGGRDPFGVQLLETGRLRAFVPGGYSQHRRRVQGTVTLSKPGLLYLQGPVGGTRVSTRSQEQSHALGEVVEVAGFVETYQGSSELAGSLTRKKADGAPIQPVEFAISGVSDPGNFDGMLVRIHGVVLESHQSPAGIEMLLSDAGKSFQAILLDPPPTMFLLKPGSEVSLTGVAEMAYELGPYFPDRNTVSNVRLLLRGPGDIVTHRVPPWWERPQAAHRPRPRRGPRRFVRRRGPAADAAGAGAVEPACHGSARPPPGHRRPFRDDGGTLASGGRDARWPAADVVRAFVLSGYGGFKTERFPDGGCRRSVGKIPHPSPPNPRGVPPVHLVPV